MVERRIVMNSLQWNADPDSLGNFSAVIQFKAVGCGYLAVTFSW